MNLISCTNNCKHQEFGYCSLKNTEKTTTSNVLTSDCMYFTPKKSCSK